MANPLLLLAPLNGSLGFRDRSGTGTLIGSGSVRYRPALGARVNYFANPGLGTDDTGWTDAGNATGSRVADADFLTGQCWETGGDDPADGADLTMQARDAALSGATLTVGIDAKRIAGDGDWTARAQLVDAAGTLIGDPGDAVAFAVGDALGRIVVTLTAPVATGAHGLQVQLRRASASAGAARFGDVTVEVGETDGSWFVPVWLNPLTGQLGTAHASPSVSQAVAWVEEGTTNLFRNPWFAVNTSGISVEANVTLQRVTTHAAQGPAAGLVTKLTNGSTSAGFSQTLATTPGQQYTFSASLRKGNGNATPSILAAGIGGTPPIPLTDAWVRHSFTFTATGASVPFAINAGASLTGNSFYVTGIQVEQKGYATSPCPAIDASGGLGTGYAWTGPAHASSSTRAAASLAADAAGHLDPVRGGVVIRYCRLIDTGGEQVLLDVGDGGAGTDRLTLRINASGQFEMAWQSDGGAETTVATTETIDVGAWVTLSAAWDGEAVAVAVDDGAWAEGTRDAPQGDWGADTLTIGARGDGTRQANGLLGPVAGMERPPTDAERARLTARARWTWGMLADRVAGALRLGSGGAVSGVLALGGD